MKDLKYTFTVYKNFLNPVLGRRELNQAGFFNLKITIREGFAGFGLLNIWGGRSHLVNLEAKVAPTLFEVYRKRRVNDRALGTRDSRANIQSLELVAGETVQTEVKAHDKCCGPSLFRNITNKNIKGRVERDCLNTKQSILSVLLARFGLIEYNVARMGNKQSCTLLRKSNRGLYHTSK